MKRILFLFISTFCICSSWGQILNKEAFEANKKWSIGLAGAYMHFPNDITRGAVGVNLTIKGFYIDVMGWPSSHKDDVEYKKWKESTSSLFHVGYQIPIIKTVRIIPIIGFAKASTTATDGTDYSVGSSGIVDSQSSSTDASGFDAGSILCLNSKKVNFYIEVTQHLLGGGIGYQF